MIIIHCPELKMAQELLNLLPCAYSEEEAIDGWNKYQDMTCYGVKEGDGLEIVFVGGRRDSVIEKYKIVEFIEWKQQFIKDKVISTVYKSMCLGDVIEACRANGIKIRKERHVMEQALIEIMVEKAMSNFNIDDSNHLESTCFFHERGLFDS